MTIPQHLLHAASAHVKRGRRTALMVRHAERHPVRNLLKHESVLLTENGHAQAKLAGTLLSQIAAHVHVAHSPVERCAETARGLVAGASSSGATAKLVCAIEALGSPFILDKARAWEMVMKIGPTFIREWFDGRLPHDIFMPRAQGAALQLDAIASHLSAFEHGLHRANGANVKNEDGDGLMVFVSHDWNIALVREEVLGIAPERAWPEFLDGVVVALEGDDVLVELDGRVGRRSRAQLRSSGATRA